ncbi:hypothetical protein HPB50_008557 [Hyalomma asiaticum]|uniref:Uncharacterized protein n=1 Tax=Hyalomma asiaticum TaxID=266040 RepID=A0ACB7RW54_HYAAI|nr:hypothetical protein HPB50_008557 [Hyalomma asiaticum]
MGRILDHAPKGRLIGLHSPANTLCSRDAHNAVDHVQAQRSTSPAARTSRKTPRRKPQVLRLATRHGDIAIKSFLTSASELLRAYHTYHQGECRRILPRGISSNRPGVAFALLKRGVKSSSRDHSA